jgi:aromatic-L-amino-acid decarboxylase
MRLAQQFAGWVDEDPDFERVAPVPFSVVCFRARPRGGAWTEASLDGLNERLLSEVNASGEVFLSHTRLDGRFVIRLAIGHLRTTEHHVRRAWEILRERAGRIASMPARG